MRNGKVNFWDSTSIGFINDNLLPVITKFLVSGFQRYIVEGDLKPSFRRRDYTKVDYLVIPDRQEAPRSIDNGESIDLLVLGGAPASYFEAKNPGMVSEYSQYVDFARHNPNIPSILIVENNLQGVMNQFGKAHPPNAVLYWTEFGNLSREKIDAVIQGRNIRATF